VGFVGIFKTETGRIRTGWRVLLFLLLMPLFWALFSLIPLQGLNWETLPALLGGLLAGWVLLALEGRGPGALGFYLSPGVPGEALLGLGLGVAVAAAVVWGMAAVGGLWWTSEAGRASEFLKDGALALWFFTLPAAAEEVLFRGYLLQSLAESWGALRALWFTSLAFGLLHLANPNTTPVGIGNIIVAGLFLGVVYLKTASLWWATAAHVGWNWALGFLADLPVSGLELVDSPLYEGVPRGATWVSGGAFGPEGSLMATAGLALAAYLVWRSPRFNPGKGALEARPLILSGTGSRTDSERWKGSLELRDSGREA
jgi:membrane protease YdiL (CAAX protease family)